MKGYGIHGKIGRGDDDVLGALIFGAPSRWRVSQDSEDKHRARRHWKKVHRRKMRQELLAEVRNLLVGEE